MGCALFNSGIFSLGHFRYQFGRSGTGFLNNTRYSVGDGAPGLVGGSPFPYLFAFVVFYFPFSFALLVLGVS